MSKVFIFTPDYEYYIDADEIIRGGTGYSFPAGDMLLPDEIEHICPDYSIKVANLEEFWQGQRNKMKKEVNFMLRDKIFKRLLAYYKGLSK